MKNKGFSIFRSKKVPDFCGRKARFPKNQKVSILAYSWAEKLSAETIQQSGNIPIAFIHG
ncbi:hypothetical protein [Okeania sp.]|uniref:hypothetical protein n=1 Tax=Okeania sp. TaxID=3100323 RepID=UPI002B4B406D|nr:hypothetical protein [Okeania sp.]MEB3339519.1 hypothetical protein [Okeania sp.]